MSFKKIIKKYSVPKEKIITWYTRYMLFAGTFGHTLFYFQAYKIFSTQSAISVTTIGFIISYFSIISWLGYGLLIKNTVLTISNIVAFSGCSLVLLGIMLYK